MFFLVSIGLLDIKSRFFSKFRGKIEKVDAPTKLLFAVDLKLKHKNDERRSCHPERSFEADRS